MPAPNLTDPFFRQLYTKLAEELDSRIHTLALGSALSHGLNGNVDTVATAMNYQKAISYIEALQSVVDLGVQIDHDRYGNKHGED